MRSGRGQRRPVEDQRVAFDQGQFLRGEAAAQPRRQIAVDFDGGDLACPLDQQQGQRAQAGADLDNALARPRVDRGDDALDVMRVVQEVLREAPSRAVALHQRPADGRSPASRSASARAAIMLPASALPSPARSSAVPWSTEVRTMGSPSVTLTP